MSNPSQKPPLLTKAELSNTILILFMGVVRVVIFYMFITLGLGIEVKPSWLIVLFLIGVWIATTEQILICRKKLQAIEESRQIAAIIAARQKERAQKENNSKP